jgi:hypothetical protein
MAAETTVRRWLGVLMVIAAVLATASAWAGQSLQHLAALLR